MRTNKITVLVVPVKVCECINRIGHETGYFKQTFILLYELFYKAKYVQTK